MKRCLLWFRRDLRLADNPALHAALSSEADIIPVFISEPRQALSPQRKAFLARCLVSLQQNLNHAGSFLILRQGNSEEELAGLIREYRADSLFWNEDVEPSARNLENKIRTLCSNLRVEAQSFPDQCIQPPGRVLKPDGKPYVVFTPYAKTWRLHTAPKPLPRPKKIPSPANFNISRTNAVDPASCPAGIELPAAGEKAALDCLNRFLASHIDQYKSKRDFPALESTSRLSPHLCWGAISPRTVLAAALKTLQQEPASMAQTSVFINELIWRDFYKSILFYFPHVATGCFRQEYDALEWENDEILFQNWCNGRTGFPLVDAAMRQLNQTGWMHNRLRMITASFLTKDLLVSWQWGERYFMNQLLDGDLAANNGGWQWAAGTGTDAQPYFRIFNPSSQTEKFDPEEKFIKTYIPEVDSAEYPKPVVSHAERRLAALRMFQKVRQNNG